MLSFYSNLDVSQSAELMEFLSVPDHVSYEQNNVIC